MAFNATGVCPKCNFRPLRYRIVACEIRTVAKSTLLLVFSRKSIGAKFDYLEWPWTYAKLFLNFRNFSQLPQLATPSTIEIGHIQWCYLLRPRRRDDLRKISQGGQGMAKVHSGEEIMPKARTLQIHNRQTTDKFAIAKAERKWSRSRKNVEPWKLTRRMNIDMRHNRYHSM